VIARRFISGSFGPELSSLMKYAKFARPAVTLAARTTTPATDVHGRESGRPRAKPSKIKKLPTPRRTPLVE
jgi:hypothetical protein